MQDQLVSPCQYSDNLFLKSHEDIRVHALSRQSAPVLLYPDNKYKTFS